MDTGNCKCFHTVKFKLTSVYLTVEHETFTGIDTETLVSILFCLI